MNVEDPALFGWRASAASSQRTAVSTCPRSISALPESSGVPLSRTGIANEIDAGSNGAEPALV
jgi:hypothetical protein